MKSILVRAIGVLAFVFLGAAPALGDEQTEANKASAIAFYEMVFNEYKTQEAFDLYVGPTYIQHSPDVPDGREAAIETLGKTEEMFPGVVVHIKRAIAEDDMVVLHSQIAGGENNLNLAVMDIFRFESGKIAEHWAVLQNVPTEVLNDNGMF